MAASSGNPELYFEMASIVENIIQAVEKRIDPIFKLSPKPI